MTVHCQNLQQISRWIQTANYHTPTVWSQAKACRAHITTQHSHMQKYLKKLVKAPKMDSLSGRRREIIVPILYTKLHMWHMGTCACAHKFTQKSLFTRNLHIELLQWANHIRIYALY